LLQRWVQVGRSQALRGAYHFFNTKQSAEAQADHFIAHVLPLTRPGDLPPVLDVEEVPAKGYTTAAYAQAISIWLNKVEAAFGQKPIIYTGNVFWRSYLGNTNRFIAHPLWLAKYSNIAPQIPGNWPAMNFWQFNDKGSEAGISPVDTNWFFGDLRALW